jgi:hypothetical protein
LQLDRHSTLAFVMAETLSSLFLRLQAVEATQRASQLSAAGANGAALADLFARLEAVEARMHAKADAQAGKVVSLFSRLETVEVLAAGRGGGGGVPSPSAAAPASVSPQTANPRERKKSDLQMVRSAQCCWVASHTLTGSLLLPPGRILREEGGRPEAEE